MTGKEEADAPGPPRRFFHKVCESFFVMPPSLYVCLVVCQEHLTNQLKAGGATIVTTLDSDLKAAAGKALVVFSNEPRRFVR